MKKIGLALILMQFLIAAGCTPVSTETAAPSPSPTAMPTQTMTPTATARPLTADDFLIVDGNIQEKVGEEWKDVAIPAEYAGEIAYVELHEGKIYGIDTADRAEVVRNDNGEWVKYERPVVGYDIGSEEWDKYYNLPGIGNTVIKVDFSGMPVDLPDLPTGEIITLSNPDGTEVNWGYQKGSYSWATAGSSENQPLPDVTHALWADFSGYFLGNITMTTSGTKNNGSSYVKDYQCFVFEIPYKYERQIFIILANASDTLNVRMVDSQNNIVGTKTMSGKELTEYLKNNMNELIGKQLTLTLGVWPKSGISDLQSNEANEPETWWKNSVDGIAFDYYFTRMIRMKISLPNLN